MKVVDMFGTTLPTCALNFKWQVLKVRYIDQSPNTSFICFWLKPVWTGYRRQIWQDLRQLWRAVCAIEGKMVFSCRKDPRSIMPWIRRNCSHMSIPMKPWAASARTYTSFKRDDGMTSGVLSCKDFYRISNLDQITPDCLFSNLFTQQNI